jgi:hypothetical protein
MFGPDQIDYYYSWQKRVLQGVLSGNAISIHFFALCGPVNCGKTWLQEAVISEMLGGYACPNQYMSEGTPFNADLFRTPHQMLSDAKGSYSFEKRRSFGSFVKDIVANTGHRCHGKGEKAIELDPIWVATCSCNTNPIERLRILPPLDEDIRDKMIITLINPGRMPMDTAEPEGKEAFRVWTARQVPAFAWWLLNEYTRISRYRIGLALRDIVTQRSKSTCSSCPLMPECAITYTTSCSAGAKIRPGGEPPRS